MEKYGNKQEVPSQVAHPGESSKGIMTDKEGIIYMEKPVAVREYIAGQGSRGFMKDQGAERNSLTPPEEEGDNMHDDKRIKSAGSFAI